MISESKFANTLKLLQVRRIIHSPLVQPIVRLKILQRFWRETYQGDVSKWFPSKGIALRFDRYKKGVIRDHFSKHKIQVSSYGGAGTTLLCKFLDQEGAGMPTLCEDWSPWKHMSYAPLDSGAPDSFRAIYIYSDPREALLSVFRRNYQHWHIQRMDGDVESWDFNCDLEQFLELKKDPFHYHRHFLNWTQAKRKYPILFIRYEELWNRLPEIIEFAGLPESAIERFPAMRTRSTSLDKVDPKVLANVNELFADLLEDIEKHPPFKILAPVSQS